MQKRQDASPQEMLAQLEGARRGLLARKTELEKKIAELEDKRKPVDIDVTSPN